MLMPRKPWCRSRLGLTSYRHFRHRLLEDSHSPRQNRFRYHYDNHHWVATASVGGSAVLEDSLYKISANLERQLCELYNLAHIHLGKPTCESPPSPAYSKRTCLHVVNTQPPTRLLLVVTRRMPISTILRKCESIWRNVSKTMPCFLSLLGLHKCAKSTSTR